MGGVADEHCAGRVPAQARGQVDGVGHHELVARGGDDVRGRCGVRAEQGEALSAGVLLVPQGVGTILSRTVTGGAIDRLGARVIALSGFAIVAVATVPFALAGPHTAEWQLGVWMVVRGFGLGAVTMPVMVAGYVGLAKDQIPHSSVLTRTAQQIGGSFGTAVLAVILQEGVAAHPRTPVDAFHTAFWWSVGFSAVAVLLSLTLPGVQRAAGSGAGAGSDAAAGQRTDAVKA
ncbi:MFS family permease [Catenulispora sp. MAP5-51]